MPETFERRLRRIPGLGLTHRTIRFPQVQEADMASLRTAEAFAFRLLTDLAPFHRGFHYITAALRDIPIPDNSYTLFRGQDMVFSLILGL